MVRNLKNSTTSRTMRIESTKKSSSTIETCVIDSDTDNCSKAVNINTGAAVKKSPLMIEILDEDDERRGNDYHTEYSSTATSKGVVLCIDIDEDHLTSRSARFPTGMKKNYKDLASGSTCGTSSIINVDDDSVQAVKNSSEVTSITQRQQSRRLKRQRVNQRIGNRNKDDEVTFLFVNEALTSTAQQANNEATCQCCFVDHPFTAEHIIQCTEGHLFCIDCVRRYAEEQLFGQNKTELKCISSTSGCESGFHVSMLKRALTDKVFAKYEEAVCRDSVRKAGIEGLCQCPKCEYQAILPTNVSVFRCTNCRHISCRHCKEDNHLPLRCDQVEKTNETLGRTHVEEAMSNAKLRQCPDCKKRFFKDEGCNKMKCACGTFICYVCKIKVTNGYKHFCQKPHCKHKDCNMCPLWGDAKVLDKVAVRKAGMDAVRQITNGKDASKALKDMSNIQSILRA